jgi:hypothetical protein
MGADPQTLSLNSTGEQYGILFAHVATKTGLCDISGTSRFGLSLCRIGVKGRRFARFHRQRASGANRQAESGSIAELFALYLGFTVHDFDGTLGTRRHTETATGAQFLVDPNYRAPCHKLAFSFPVGLLWQYDFKRKPNSALRADVLAVATVSTLLLIQHNSLFREA